MTVSDPNDTEWIPDTGATSRMTNDAGIFTSLAPYNGKDTIIIGDGKSSPISHIGNASIPTTHGNLDPTNVLLVPKLPKISSLLGN